MFDDVEFTFVVPGGVSDLAGGYHVDGGGVPAQAHLTRDCGKTAKLAAIQGEALPEGYRNRNFQSCGLCMNIAVGVVFAEFSHRFGGIVLFENLFADRLAQVADVSVIRVKRGPARFIMGNRKRSVEMEAEDQAEVIGWNFEL